MPTFGFWRAEEKSSKPKKNIVNDPRQKSSPSAKTAPRIPRPRRLRLPQNHYSTHMRNLILMEGNEGVMGSRRMFVCKIGWVQRNENRGMVYAKVAECLPFPVRPDTMDSVEWEELRMKGNSRCEWISKAIGVLKKGEYWESLPVEQFRERHAEVKKMSGVGDFEDEKRAWKRRVDRATRHFDHSGDVLAYRETLKELGPEPGLSSEAKQARYLDKIMNDVGAALYSKHEEPSKFSDKYRRRGE
ncbi:ab67fcfe-ef0c-499a-8b27-833b53dc2a08-CDS [Sclerotinia trifoliorum]|uniref:Ab67fcfe-ef0c-499a-8b27-833b53dc2a08-CDS n=1 Tax=Sclerotinia trifoliorum TaxID=28548 RepID=A0A8H2ZU93_9HELO|nr:ab67fcfe-ef0c-499a-8b27-833b53dc2a08-CDS [Sclerotinia trifoliorum]